MIQRLLPTKSKSSLFASSIGVLTFSIALFLFLAVLSSTSFAQTIRYVTEFGGFPQDDGSSWQEASSDLQATIYNSQPGDQIWVAAGTYPASQFGDGYEMKEGVKIYGGFAGSESSLAQRNRTLSENTSFLQANGNQKFAIDNTRNQVTNAALLDGFSISGGTVATISNNGSSPKFVNLVFAARQGLSGMANVNASPTLVNCLIIADQPSCKGMSNSQQSSPTIINCTIAGNAGKNGSIGMENTNSAPLVINTIIAGSSIGVQSGIGANARFNNSLVSSISGFNPLQPIIADPVYANAATGDYQLQLCSRAINAGNNEYYSPSRNPNVSDVTTDLIGNPRFYNNGMVDIGAFEYQGERAESVPGIWFVKEGATGSGLNWDCATGDIQAAIDQASNGQQVWVAKGTYKPKPDKSYGMKSGVKIYGHFFGTEQNLSERNLSSPENESILTSADAAQFRYPPTFENGIVDSTGVLDGFTLANGWTAIRNGVEGPTLVNLIIRDNTAGITNDSEGSPKLINCLMFNNENGDVFVGYASSAELVNCTIISRRPEYGIIAYNGGSLKVKNSVIAGIIKNDGGESISVQYSLVTSVSNPAPADHNIPGNIDPLFVNAAAGDYRLQPCSPLINKGYNAFAAGETPDMSFITTDLEDHPRIRELRVDIGAYEYNGASRELAGDGDVASGSVSHDYTLSTTNGSCKVLASLAPSGAAPVSGQVAAKVWVVSSQPSKFVKRHYQITPETNAANASAKLTLYFTQQEFDDFNAVSNIQLPQNAADTENFKANLRIEKRAGTSNDDSGLPNSYAGTISTFKPSEANGKIEWNADAQYWEVSFEVTGFSGFFVKTTESALPLNLISFTAIKEKGSNLLQWSTASEVNTDNFEVQSSGDAKKFVTLATLNAGGSGNHQYTYNDQIGYSGNIYYRLKMSDLDATFTYSKIISLAGEGNLAAVYPSPAKEFVTFEVDNALLKTTANLHDISGRKVQSIVITNIKQEIDIKSLASGLYILKFANGTADRFLKE